MTITCECCNHELNRKEIIEELADRLDWEEGFEYGINESDYDHKKDQITIYKKGFSNLLEFVREKNGDQYE